MKYPKTRCYFCHKKLIVDRGDKFCNNRKCALENQYTIYKEDGAISFDVRHFCSVFIYKDNTMAFYFERGEPITEMPLIKIDPKNCKKEIIKIRDRNKKLQAFS